MKARCAKMGAIAMVMAALLAGGAAIQGEANSVSASAANRVCAYHAGLARSLQSNADRLCYPDAKQINTPAVDAPAAVEAPQTSHLVAKGTYEM